LSTNENTRLTTALRKATSNDVDDVGDYSEHRLKVEKTLGPIPELALPSCVFAARATPKEGGGVPGDAESFKPWRTPAAASTTHLASRHWSSLARRWLIA